MVMALGAHVDSSASYMGMEIGIWRYYALGSVFF